MNTPDSRFDVQPSVSNHFAWIRTQMGLQRTLMAGVRTAISLIGFGFTVAQFFQRMQVQGDTPGRLGPEAPRNLGMVLIATGVLSLCVFIWQYHRGSHYLESGPFQAIGAASKKPLHTSTYFISGVVILIGIAAFVSVFAGF